jgi:hypothetical protein
MDGAAFSEASKNGEVVDLHGFGEPVPGAQGTKPFPVDEGLEDLTRRACVDEHDSVRSAEAEVQS